MKLSYYVCQIKMEGLEYQVKLHSVKKNFQVSQCTFRPLPSLHFTADCSG